MNEDPFPDPLEERLRALRPRTLPPALRSRLLAVEPPPIKHRSLRWPTLAAPVGILAAMALAIAHAVQSHPSPASLAIARPAGPQPSDFRVFLPADRRSTLLSVSEAALVDGGPERQIRLVRAVWLDDTTYIGDDHTTLHRQTARTEFIPIALNSY